ncbi:aminotransferase class V-fold PLP-dependent enzyme [[Acholeplasma] multilocale]|uniref:aminotransferase class V-fold PLP-dependent enzyme n=1 Tax=[Acholeplasma] multilocale TaxID=264638 RepID=UPI00047ABF7E|nr:aminotransferase class V-fold PLP-dependent enzyme [[Acholeplasma] multilocale]
MLIKRDHFPVLKNNKGLIYFDNGATTLKPSSVIDAEVKYLEFNGANPHTNDYDNAYLSNEIISNTRTKIANLIGAKNNREIIFTSGTTFSLNQAAFGLKSLIEKDDEIFVTNLEHSSNLLPWINVANQQKAVVKNLILTDDNTIDIDQIKNQITPKTKVVAFAHVSNTIGAENDVESIVKEIRKVNEKVIIVVDAAQSVAHTKIDVTSWDIDLLAFSAHKMYGPFGLGVLWGKAELLNQMEPIIFGGGMSAKIEENLVDYTLSPIPDKFEGGTPNISSIAAFEKAVDFLLEIGVENIKNHEKNLKKYAIQQIEKFNLNETIDFYNLDNDSPILMLNVKGINPQDIATFLDSKYKIATRSGSHCARRVVDSVGVKVSLRISFAIYNTKEEIDILIEALSKSENFLDAIF